MKYQYSSPPLVRQPFLLRNCGHIKEVTVHKKDI